VEAFDSHGDRAVVREEVAPEEFLQSREGRRTRARQVLTALFMAVMAAVTVLPIWAVKYPPLLDYPNHLASSYVLAHLQDYSLPFHAWYAAQWGLYPYVAMDAILRALQLFLPVEMAGRLYLTLAVLALPAAMWFFLRQSNPGQDAMACWALVGTHNIFFLLGYLNFYVGLAFCFLALGLWLKWSAHPSPFSWLLAMLAFTATYFSHLIAFAIAAIAVTAYCVFARQSLRTLLLAWVMFVPGACCYLYSARILEKQHSGFVFLELSEKISNLHGMMHGYSDALDVVTLVAFCAYFLGAWFRNREFRWNWRWIGVGALLLAAYFLMPWAYGDGSDLDLRILPVLFGITLAFARVGRRAWWLAPLVLALFFVRVGNITYNYRSMQPELNGLAASFDRTFPDARVLPIIQSDEGSDALHHAFAHFWAYGVIRRHWFSPYLFELRGLNPLRIAQPSYTLDGFWDLDYRETPDWRAVQADYDFVWSYNAPQYDADLKKIGALTYSDGKLRLYRLTVAR
jgi:hypothetical protein